ncbi:permease-like cell division protein FtsX [Thermodesulfobacteriota bacterium]
MLRKLAYCISTALLNIRKNKLLSLLTTTTIAICFMIFISFLIVFLNLSAFKKSWVEGLQVIVYLKPDINADAIEKTKIDVAAHEEVASIHFVSSSDALTILRTALKGQDGILEGLSENPLPHSLEIKLKNKFLTVAGVETFVNRIQKHAHIQDIEYGEKWLERFIAFFEIMTIISFSLGGFLFLFTLFIISNTIKLMVYSRRDEIEIMRLVGATNLFIQMPFWIEGIIQGCIGAAFALLAVGLVMNLCMGKLIEFLQFYFGSGNLIFLDFTLMLAILAMGALLGLAGSLFSLNRLEELQT